MVSKSKQKINLWDICKRKFKYLHYNPSYLHGIEEAQPLSRALLEALQIHQRQLCCCLIVSPERLPKSPLLSKDTNKDYRIGEQRLSLERPLTVKGNITLYFSHGKYNLLLLKHLFVKSLRYDRQLLHRLSV